MKSKQIRVQNLKTKAILTDPCDVAESFMKRLIGLMGHSQLSEGHGLWFPRCNSIHMWFMRVSLDVIFLKKSGDGSGYVVTSAHSSVRPWRLLPLWDDQATDTLELPSGVIQKQGVHVGDVLCIG